MSASSQDTAPGRWRRFWTIVGVFVALAPLGNASLFVAGLLAVDFIDGRVHAAEVLIFIWAYCVPLALVSGALFGALAVFRGHALLWVALAPAILMLPAVNTVVGETLLYFHAPSSLLVLALFMLPLAAARYLSRPWAD